MLLSAMWGASYFPPSQPDQQHSQRWTIHGGPGAIVSFDVNVRPSLWASHAAIRDTIAKGVERADILKLSFDEAEFVDGSPTDPPEKDWLNTLGKSSWREGLVS